MRDAQERAIERAQLLVDEDMATKEAAEKKIERDRDAGACCETCYFFNPDWCEFTDRAVVNDGWCREWCAIEVTENAKMKGGAK